MPLGPTKCHSWSTTITVSIRFRGVKCSSLFLNSDHELGTGLFYLQHFSMSNLYSNSYSKSHHPNRWCTYTDPKCQLKGIWSNYLFFLKLSIISWFFCVSNRTLSSSNYIYSLLVDKGMQILSLRRTTSNSIPLRKACCQTERFDRQTVIIHLIHNIQTE